MTEDTCFFCEVAPGSATFNVSSYRKTDPPWKVYHVCSTCVEKGRLSELQDFESARRELFQDSQ